MKGSIGTKWVCTFITSTKQKMEFFIKDFSKCDQIRRFTLFCAALSKYNQKIIQVRFRSFDNSLKVINNSMRY